MSDEAPKGAPKAPQPSTPDLDELDSDWGTDGDEADGGATVVGRLEDLIATTRIDSDAHDTDRPSDVITARPPPMAEGGPTVVIESETTISEDKVLASETETKTDAPVAPAAGVTSNAPPVAAAGGADDDREDDDEDEEEDEDDDDEVDDSAWDIPEEPEPPEVAKLSPEERAAAKKARDEVREARREKAKAKALAAREKKKARAQAVQKKQKRKKRSIRPPKPATTSNRPPKVEAADQDSGPLSGDPSPTLRKARPKTGQLARGRDWQRMAAFVIAVVVVGALLLWLLKHRS